MSATTASPEARALAARLVWGSLEGTALTPGERALVGTGLGGVVLFPRNVASPDQVRGLIEELRATAPGPIHVAVDHEGGHVVRLGEPLTRFPSAMALDATGSESLARAVAAASARELAALGIDVVVAPALVARLGAAMVEGYVAGGVLPVVRHDLDPDAPHMLAAAVAAGAPAFMAPQIVDSPHGPAAMLRAAVERLRDGLGFDGLVVTDALVMDAIADRTAIDQAAVEAIVAGADVAMALEPAGRVIEALATALECGVLPRARVREAIRRVDAFAARAAGGTADAGRLAYIAG